LEVLSLTRKFGLIPQNERFIHRIATKSVKKYEVVKKGQIVYNPYVIWEGAIHSLKKFRAGIVSPVYLVWETKINCEWQYLDNLLRTEYMLKEYSKYSSGAVNRRRSIKKTLFVDIKIPLPPFQEQKNIALVLSKIQDAKEKTEAVLNSLKELKKSLMKHLFTYGAVSFEEADKVKMKETEIGEVPDHWVIKKMIDFATFQRGKDLPKSKQRDGNYPVVGSGGVIGYHDKFVCEGPGLVTGRSGSIGTLTYVEGRYWPHNTGLYAKDFHSNHPKYVYYFLHSFNFKKYATGVSVPTLNRNFIHSELVKVPPVTEQEHIASILSAVDAKIGTEEMTKESLNQLFKSMLCNLLSAKIRVNILET